MTALLSVGNSALNKSIGIFDSGVGGLTVMRQIHETLPYENICYFGDTARVPYGNKSPETIRRYAMENALFLLQQDIKLLVIACNTASAFAADYLSRSLAIPVIGVIEPGVEQAIEATKTGRIAVIGTKGTIESGLYQQGLKKALPTAEIFAAPCPLLVHFVEEQLFHHPATRLFIEDYINPLKAQQPDTFVLGCTHYPLLAPLFQEILGPDVTLINPGISAARTVQRLLQERGELKSGPEKGTCTFFVSDDTAKFKAIGEYFLQKPLQQVNRV